jgi:hypothetical protein
MLHNPWHDIPAGKHAPEQVTAIIEIPAGSRNKYELDKETGHFKLDRVLYSAVHYPSDYGFIPQTLHEDGDPMDILVKINEPTFTGCQIASRPIGVLRMLDKGEPDERSSRCRRTIRTSTTCSTSRTCHRTISRKSRTSSASTKISKGSASRSWGGRMP